MKLPFEIQHTTIRTLLYWVLWLIAIHSICFGLSLIILPCNILQYFGFDISQKFFATQGGVFHLIISFAYIRAASKLDDSEDLITLAVITKFAATIFLISYYFFGTGILLILLSGFGDFLMGLAILLLYMLYKSTAKEMVTA